MTTRRCLLALRQEDIAPEERREQAIEVEILEDLRGLHRRLDDLEKRDR